MDLQEENFLKERSLEDDKEEDQDQHFVEGSQGKK